MAGGVAGSVPAAQQGTPPPAPQQQQQQAARPQSGQKPTPATPGADQKKRDAVAPEIATKEDLRAALLELVRDDAFINAVWKEMGRK